MQSAVPAVPIKLINQALLMARATSAWHEVCGKGCWGAAEGALVGGRPPCGASSRPADAEGEPCLGSWWAAGARDTAGHAAGPGVNA